MVERRLAELDPAVAAQGQDNHEDQKAGRHDHVQPTEILDDEAQHRPGHAIEVRREEHDPQ
jgi:hypothetical protein